MPGYIPPLQYSLIIIQRRMLVVRDAIDAASSPGYLLFWSQQHPDFKLKLFWRQPCAQIDGTELIFDCDPALWSEDPKIECDLADTVSLLDGDDRVVIERMHMKLREGCIRPADLRTLLAKEMGPSLRRIRQIPDCAPRPAGLGDGDAHHLIRAEVVAALTDISALPEPEPEATPRPPARKRPTTAVDVDALRTNLAAELQEFENALASGALVRIDAAISEYSDRLERLRSALLILPGRVASRLGRLDARGAKALLSREVEAAIKEGGSHDSKI